MEELKLLSSLASDQLFRREFIDPKMPGYRADAGELSLAKALVLRLQLLLAQHAPRTPAVVAIPPAVGRRSNSR